MSSLVPTLAAISPIVAAAVGVWLASRIKQVHTLVNSQMTAALARISDLEAKLGLSAGEAIPGPQLVTTATSQHAEPSGVVSDQGVD